MALFFTLGSAVQIKAGNKTRTMRLWLSERVKVGNVYKAKLNRRSQSTFAMIKIVSVRQWDGIEALDHKHALKEGFRDIDDFWQDYLSLNAHKMDDPRRNHYIIDFEVVAHLDSMPRVPDLKTEAHIPQKKKGTIQGGLPFS